MIYFLQTLSAIVHGKVRLDLFCDTKLLGAYTKVGFKENLNICSTSDDALRKAFHWERNDVPKDFHDLYLD